MTMARRRAAARRAGGARAGRATCAGAGGDDEVLIKVAAAGLNRADILQRRGFYPSPPGAPSYPGLEVVRHGRGARRATSREFKVGDAVCALLQGGGYAEYCASTPGKCCRFPDRSTWSKPLSLPEAMFTVWSNVFEFGRLQPGETLLVHGGSSGIGVAAIQLAAARGHTVFTTAGSDDKCRFCESLGARRAINYKSEDFVAEIAKEDRRARCRRRARHGRRQLCRAQSAGARDRRPARDDRDAGRREGRDRRAAHHAAAAGGYGLDAATALQRSSSARSAISCCRTSGRCMARGAIRPVVDWCSRWPSRGAHARMESGEHKGKIILAVVLASRVLCLGFRLCGGFAGAVPGVQALRGSGGPTWAAVHQKSRSPSRSRFLARSSRAEDPASRVSVGASNLRFRRVANRALAAAAKCRSARSPQSLTPRRRTRYAVV